MALCIKLVGSASGFAPTSKKTNGSFLLGIIAASAGRPMPSIGRNRMVPPAIIAPVFPQLTIASASLFFTNSMALSMEESFFFFSARIGFSSIPMTSLASKIRMRSV